MCVRQESEMIYAQDNNRVYMELAKNKPLSSIDAESIYQLKPGKGKNYIEFDVDTDLLEWIENPRYHRMELTVKGDDGMDDIERACEDIIYWAKPGDFSSETWIK